jgi:hypothetical protein
MKVQEGILPKNRVRDLKREYKRLLKKRDSAWEAGNLIAAAEARKAAQRKRGIAYQLLKNEEIKEEFNANAGPRGVDDQDAAERMAQAKFDFDERLRIHVKNVEFEKGILRDRAHGLMHQVFEKFRPRVGGIRNAAHMDNVVRELFGEDTGDDIAKAAAQGFAEAAEYLRREFNRAGGAIPKLENWGLPQRHDPRKMRRVSKNQWVRDIDDLLDHEQMIDHETGLPMDAEKRREVLGEIYDTLLNPFAKKFDADKGHFPANDITANRMHQRFLIFRDADSWLQYQKAYGASDSPARTFDTMMKYVDDMSNDIGMMRALGPRPDDAVKQIKNEVKARGGTDRGGSFVSIDALYSLASGRAETPDKEWIANIGHTIRNTVNAATLGGAVIPSLTDTSYREVALGFATGRRNPIKGISRHLGTIKNRADQEQLIRMGLGAKGVNNRLAEMNRQMTDESDSRNPFVQGSRWINQVVMKASGLEQWTSTGRWTAQFELLNELTQRSNRMWSELPEALQRSFRRFDIDENDWDSIRGVDLPREVRPEADEAISGPDVVRFRDKETGASVIHPMGVAKAAPEAADKLHRFLMAESRWAVPTPGLKQRAILTQGTQSGTVHGEFMRTATMLKSFPLTQVMLQTGRALYQNPNWRSVAAYTGTLMAATSFMGAVTMEIDNVIAGRDPRLPGVLEEGGTELASYMAEAAARGGALGLMGDVIFGQINQFGFYETLLGPAFQTGKSFSEAVYSTPTFAARLMAGDDVEEAAEESDIGREWLDFAERINPLGSLWFLEPVMERAIFDNLQKQFDPEAENSFRAEEEFVEDRLKTEYFWQPGETLPERPPSIEE